MKMGVDSSDIKKHRDDIIRIVSELMLEPVHLPEEVEKDMTEFVDAFEVTAAELKSLGIKGVTAELVKNVLKDTYLS